MKKSSLLIIIMIICLIGCPSGYGPECGGSSNTSEEKKLSVQDLVFDSLKLTLSAKVNVDDGREITAVCNGKTQTAKASGSTIIWDMSSSFYSGIKGGTDNEVQFSAKSKYSGTVTKSITYWPKAAYTLYAPNEVTIYNGSTQSYQPPSYTINYDTDKVSLSQTFKLYDANDTEMSTDTSSWNLAQMLTFLADPEHAGCRVDVSFSITPRCYGGASLAANGMVTYYCKADVLVSSVEIGQVYDYRTSQIKTFLYDAEGEDAGGNIAYQWEKSADGSDWAVIAGETGDTYTPLNSDFGSKIRVTITQTLGNIRRNPISSNVIELPKDITLSNLNFNSLNYILTADINLPDGIEVTAVCNGVEQTAAAMDGKITFSMENAFRSDVLGGHSYEVTFRAEWCDDTSDMIEYYPIVRCQLSTDAIINIYNGTENDYVMPEFTTNYGDYYHIMYMYLGDDNDDEGISNDDENDINVSDYANPYKDNPNLTKESWIEVHDTTTDRKGYIKSGDKLDVDTSAWDWFSILDFLIDTGNVGKSLELHIKFTPNCANGEELSDNLCVTFHCLSDVLVKEVTLDRSGGVFTAHLHAETDETDNESLGDSAGGHIVYQWQYSNNGSDWQDIIDASKKSYTITEDNQHKYLRVVITQTFEDVEQKPLTAATTYKIEDFVIENNLLYEGIVPQGMKAGVSNDESLGIGKIIGEVTTYFGKTLSTDDTNDFVLQWDDSGTYDESHYRPSSSAYLGYKVAGGYLLEDTHLSVYVPVCSVLAVSDVPPLRTDTDTITVGCAEFTAIDGNLEISFDGGVNYTSMPESEFQTTSGKALYIRKRAFGTPNEMGWIKESEPIMITVTAANIGKKTTGGGLIDGFDVPTFSLEQKLQDGKIYITPTLDIVEPEIYTYQYEWMIDFMMLDNWDESIITENETHQLILDPTKLGQDVYQVYCTVGINLLSINIMTLSAQTAVDNRE